MGYSWVYDDTALDSSKDKTFHSLKQTNLRSRLALLYSRSGNGRV